MPWQKGHQYSKGHGRPGYVIEQAQLKKMRNILTRDLNILEKTQNAKTELNPLDEKKLQIAKERVMKIMDKLHASKQETDVTSLGEKILVLPVEIIEKNGLT